MSKITYDFKARTIDNKIHSLYEQFFCTVVSVTHWKSNWRKKYWCLENFSWWKACLAKRFLKILGKTSCSEFYFSHTVSFHSGICLRKKNNLFTSLNREIYLNAFLILNRMLGKGGEVSRTFKRVMIIFNKSMLVLINYINTNVCNLLIFLLF